MYSRGKEMLMSQKSMRLRRHLTTFQMMILGFALLILVGALVLMLPVCSAAGNWTSFHESLFTATSATCVTGLVVRALISSDARGSSIRP